MSDTDVTGFESAADKSPAPAPVPAERDGSGNKVFAGYPVTKYHPVYGRKDANDPNEAATLFQPPHNWFDTAGAADMARTDREAQQVIQNNLAVKVAAKTAIVNGDEPPKEEDRAGIVRNSVQAQESVDAGKVEPL